MKNSRKFIAVLGAAAIIVSGCSLQEQKAQAAKEKAQQHINAGYAATMEIQYGDIAATATMEQQNARKKSITFLSPPAMKGMSFVAEGQQITVSYRGLSANFTIDDFFQSAIAKQLITVADRVAAEEGIHLCMEDESLTIEGSGEDGEFLLSIDKENGNFLHLSVPSQQLEVNFTNFTYLQ